VRIIGVEAGGKGVELNGIGLFSRSGKIKVDGGYSGVRMSGYYYADSCVNYRGYNIFGDYPDVNIDFNYDAANRSGAAVEIIGDRINASVGTTDTRLYTKGNVTIKPATTTGANANQFRDTVYWYATTYSNPASLTLGTDLGSTNNTADVYVHGTQTYSGPVAIYGRYVTVYNPISIVDQFGSGDTDPLLIEADTGVNIGASATLNTTGTTTIENSTSGAVSLNANITSGEEVRITSAGTGYVNLNGHIYVNGSRDQLLVKSATYITTASSETFRTNYGPITFWSNSADSTTANGYIDVGSSVMINTANGYGAPSSLATATSGYYTGQFATITLAGGAADPDNSDLPAGNAFAPSGVGMAGVRIQSSTNLVSGGGDVTIRGKSNSATS